MASLYECYEWHQTDREDLNEGWIWVRANNTTTNKLRERTKDRRPVLLLKHQSKSVWRRSKSVCCETLWADPRFLRNRRYPILIGTIKDVASQADFKVVKVVDEEEVETPVHVGSYTKFELSDGTASDEKMLTTGQPVCVRGKEKTDGGPVQVYKVTFDFNGNLIFLSAWYRHCLGIDIEEPGSKICLKVVTPKWWLLQPPWWQLRACARHPQIAVVMSTVLAVIGTGLGIVGLAAVLKDFLGPGVCGRT